MKLRKTDRPSARQPDLTSLINIVFLILIFFIVAGTLRPFSARDIELAKVGTQAAGVASPSTLIAHADGRITYRGQDVNLGQLATLLQAAAPELKGNAHKTFSIVADGRLPGSDFLNISRAVRANGIENVSIMVERARQ